MDFLTLLKNGKVYLDGGMGTLLFASGLEAGELPERWNVSHPDTVTGIHRAYLEAGSDVISANTFGANSLKFSDGELDELIGAAMRNARAAIDTCSEPSGKFVALDIGPTGRLLKPLGDLDFEDAVSIFAKTVRLGVKHGADLIIIETMNDSYETKAALLAAKENSELPVIVTNAYGEDGKLMSGAEPEAMAAMLEGMGADAIGANCSLGPRQLAGVARRLLECSSVPVVLKPNAGLPTVSNGVTAYDVGAEEFASDLAELVREGVRVVGGCCGTTPEYIAALVRATRNIEAREVSDKGLTVVSSYTHAVRFGGSPILIGERINPTGKKRFKQALVERDIGYILSEAVAEEEAGAHILDVNVGLPEIDETEMLTSAVCELQAITALPLQIDTSSPEAMEAAMRRYNGKPMVNSVSGKTESMEAVFPLVKKYGGVVVALTLDESGIPATVEGRMEIASRIIARAEKYGIPKKDIVFDTLALTVSADSTAARVTLGALGRIRREFGCNTSLGVSNVSFGLPERDAVNSAFFAMALSEGLSAAIMNPHSIEMMRTYYAYCALSGCDESCAEYIRCVPRLETSRKETRAAALTGADTSPETSELQRAIVKGFKDRAAELVRGLLNTVPPMKIVEDDVIPALNIVGKGFEEKRVYLPQLLMSAEAAKSAFEVIKSVLPSTKSGRGTVVIATVHGDIHDIGKNIVKLLLENYGFDVHDLGRDVPPETVVSETLRLGAPLVGLSALMTTTVPAMQRTVALLKKEAPQSKIVVGGAVLTEEYAASMGADKYAADAMETVRYAEQIFSSGN